MKGIGIGTSDFEKMRRLDNYYIDKTMYIKDIIDNKSEVILITRPRRFGKTLNMSMLRYYFDMNQKDSKEMFRGLKILEQEEKYTSKMNYYPCIYVTFNDVRATDYDKMLFLVQNQLVEIFIEHSELLKSEKLLDIEKEMFNTVLNFKANETQIENALKLLSRLLYKEYDRNVMLLIDEYDVPIQNAYVNGYYNKAIEFFKTFYGTTFKDNKYLEKTVITGVSRVAKESIFSRSKQF